MITCDDLRDELGLFACGELRSELRHALGEFLSQFNDGLLREISAHDGHSALQDSCGNSWSTSGRTPSRDFLLGQDHGAVRRGARHAGARPPPQGASVQPPELDPPGLVPPSPDARREVPPSPPGRLKAQSWTDETGDAAAGKPRPSPPQEDPLDVSRSPPWVPSKTGPSLESTTPDACSDTSSHTPASGAEMVSGLRQAARISRRGSVGLQRSPVESLTAIHDGSEASGPGIQRCHANTWDSESSDDPSPTVRRHSVQSQRIEDLMGGDIHRTAWGKKSRLNKLKIGSQLHAVICKLVMNTYFDYMMCVFLCMNAVLIGLEVNYAATHSDGAPDIFKSFDKAFCIVFTSELAVRIYVYRGEFCGGSDWRWNVFDVLVVSFQLFEELINAADGGANVGNSQTSSGALRMFRILRLLRVFRMLRIVRFVQELNNIMYLIVGSFASFIWTFALLMLLTYVAAVLVTQLVADHNADSGGEGEIQQSWGSVGESVFSLYQAISGGVDWKDIADPLAAISPVLLWLFAGYIAFSALVMLNLVTGVFVDGAQRLRSRDKELELVGKLRMVLESANIEEGGHITWEEFHAQLNRPELNAFFESINMDKTEAGTVFQLLDTAGEGAVTAEDFVLGGLRLQGPATAIDLAKMQLENTLNTRMLLEEVGKGPALMKELAAAPRPETSSGFVPRSWSTHFSHEAASESVMQTPVSGAHEVVRSHRKAMVRATACNDPLLAHGPVSSQRRDRSLARQRLRQMMEEDEEEV